MIEIMQSATGINLIIGPFVSQADGKTPIEGVDLTTADSAIIFKHGATSASYSIDSATWTSMGSGYYSLAATSTMFDTLGPAKIAVNDVSICLPYHLDVMVTHDNYWNAKYSTSPFMASASGGTIASVSNSVNFTTGTIASVSNSVWFTAGTIASVSNPVSAGTIASVSNPVSLLAGQTIASISNSVWFTAGTIASVSNSVWWTAIRDVGTVTGSVASVSAIGIQTIASVSGSVYDRVIGIASIVWSALSADYGVGGTFGGILGGLGAGADPWSSTVTNYTGTNTFGLLLGGLPSTTTLASTLMGVIGKTAYIPSATVEQWTIASVSNSVALLAGQTIASVSNSVWFTAGTIASVSNPISVGTVASVSNPVTLVAGQTLASISNSVWFTAGTIASVSNSVWFTAGTIASVSNSVWMSTMTGNITGNLTGNITGNLVGIVASFSVAAIDDVWDEVVDGVYTGRQSLRLQNSFAAGKAAVAAGSATVSFRDLADTKNRIVMDVDDDGNRTTVTKDAT